MKELPDWIIGVLVTYACIGIFGSFFVGIHALAQNIHWEKWFALYMLVTGMIVATFNYIYDEMVEVPKTREYVRGLPPEVRKMFGDKYQ